MLKKLIVLLLLQVGSLLLFCVGFFPKKNVLHGLSDFEFNVDLQNNSKPTFDKLIFVVIDALRSDFLFDENISKFSFIHEKLNTGEAWGFTAYSNPPTVTLPRLKGITTGSTPNFLDAILNVAEGDNSSGISDSDSWLNQLRRKAHHRIRFFGDDTWLKLFAPAEEFFDSWEGTNSFFVSDFEQVDLNVTRHIPKQLNEMSQWDSLILHYLGLDHIGHKGGAYSKFMASKHIEMDTVVKELYENIDENTLIVVAGDHGMNDVGNHGGSSAGETHAGLAFLSPKLKKFTHHDMYGELKAPYKTKLNEDGEPTFEYLEQIQQEDIVPTLATLFNVPIPKNSVGIFIRQFLPLIKEELAYVKLLENYKQLSNLINKRISSQVNLTIDQLYNEMQAMQENLTRTSTNYNYRYLAIGYIILVFVTICCCILIYQQIKVKIELIVLLLISFFLGSSTFGSSFVEEEHQLWWWLVTGFLAITAFCKNRNNATGLSCLIVFIGVRLIRGWNNTGQKSVYWYVINNLLKLNSTFQWNFILVSLSLIGFSTRLNTIHVINNVILSFVVFVYKINWAVVNKEHVPEYCLKLLNFILVDLDLIGTRNMNDSLIPIARLFYKLWTMSLLVKITTKICNFEKNKTFLEGFKYDITIFLIFCTSPSNIPQFLIFEIIGKCLIYLVKKDHGLKVYLVSSIFLIFQYFTFFQFGGTNSIATIDLTNAYHGISDNYNIYVVGWLMTISNFAPAIYWSIYPWTFLYQNVVHKRSSDMNKWEIFAKNKLPVLFFQCVVGCCLLAACLVLRYHLFIWSVFSPKLCYYVVWNVFVNIVIGWGLESIIVSLL